MIRTQLTNEILQGLLDIEREKARFSGTRVSPSVTGKLRKSSRKKSSYASAKIEGNPLSATQADAAIESPDRHFLKPEQEVRNYFKALEFLEVCRKQNRQFSRQLILDIQKIVVSGESAEKIGFRGPMPPGVLFAVYDDKTGRAEYIPPEAKEVVALIDELVKYVETTDDHPVLRAAIVHYCAGHI